MFFRGTTLIHPAVPLPDALIASVTGRPASAYCRENMPVSVCSRPPGQIRFASGTMTGRGRVRHFCASAEGLQGEFGNLRLETMKKYCPYFFQVPLLPRTSRQFSEKHPFLTAPLQRLFNIRCYYKKNVKISQVIFTHLLISPHFPWISSGFAEKPQPRATSNIIISVKPKATPMVPMLECFPAWDSGTSSSTTT